MNQSRTHERRHPTWPDRWNPYQARETFTPLLDNERFKLILSTVTTDWECRLLLDFMGCLDAPEEIPCGSTLRIQTIGGFEREMYNRQRRDCQDWKVALRAEAAVAAMIKEILAEES